MFRREPVPSTRTPAKSCSSARSVIRKCTRWSLGPRATRPDCSAAARASRWSRRIPRIRLWARRVSCAARFRRSAPRATWRCSCTGCRRAMWLGVIRPALCLVEMATLTSSWPELRLCASFSARRGCCQRCPVAAALIANIVPWLPTLSRVDADCGVRIERLFRAISRWFPSSRAVRGEPWRYNSVVHLMFGVVVNFDSGAGPHLYVCLAGSVREVGESHMLFPSDASPWRRRDAKFIVRQRDPSENSSLARQRLCDPRSRIVCGWGAGNMSSAPQFAAGAPARLVCGGVPGVVEPWLEINRPGSRTLGLMPRETRNSVCPSAPSRRPPVAKCPCVRRGQDLR